MREIESEAVAAVPADVAPDARASERRRFARYICEGFAEVVVLFPNTLVRGEVSDVSLGGCFIRTRAKVRVKVDSEAYVRFQLNGRQYKLEGRVASLQMGMGVGFEFHYITAQQMDLLDQLILELKNSSKIANA